MYIFPVFVTGDCKLVILSASGVVTEFSNLYLGRLNDGKCSNLSVCIDMSVFGWKHHVGSLNQHVSFLVFI